MTKSRADELPRVARIVSVDGRPMPKPMIPDDVVDIVYCRWLDHVPIDDDPRDVVRFVLLECAAYIPADEMACMIADLRACRR